MNLLSTVSVCKESPGRWQRVPVIALVLLLILSGASMVRAFPLDGDKYTGITRLEGYRLAQEGKVHGHKLPAGAMLKTEQVEAFANPVTDFTVDTQGIPVLLKRFADLPVSRKERTNICIGRAFANPVANAACEVQRLPVAFQGPVPDSPL